MNIINGVIIKELNPILDERGYLQECLRSDWPMFDKFGQAYITIAFPNIVKAWHRHKIQTDNMTCVMGDAKLVLYDGQEEFSTYKQINEIFFGEKNPSLVTIPNKIWHGFNAIGGKMILILNIPTELYNYNEPDEYRLPYNKKKIDYDWEIKMG